MSLQVRPIAAAELDDYPDDGLRREVIEGELFVAAAPAEGHQRVSMRLSYVVFQAVEMPGIGRVYAAPVDVRFSEVSQVQPDLIVLLRERRSIYRGHVVFGAPDIVIEILSPSNRSYDLVKKARLYEEHGVPEYWTADPDAPWLRQQALVGGRFVPVEPEADGRFRSTVVPGLVLDPGFLFGDLG